MPRHLAALCSVAFLGACSNLPSQREIDRFLVEWDDVADGERAEKLDAFLYRLQGETRRDVEDLDAFQRAIAFDKHMAATWERTRDRRILQGYLRTAEAFRGNGGMRVCSFFEDVWARDGNGRTLQDDHTAQSFIDGCPRITGRELPVSAIE